MLHTPSNVLLIIINMASVQLGAAHNFSRPMPGCIASKVQSLFWRVTSLRRGVVLTGRNAFLLEDTTLCGGGVHFDLEEGV